MSVKRIIKREFNKQLIKRFANTYEFCNNDLSNFILLLRKGVYPDEYIVIWERFDETLWPNKNAFHSHLNLMDITDKEVTHAQKVFEEFR